MKNYCIYTFRLPLAAYEHISISIYVQASDFAIYYKLDLSVEKFVLIHNRRLLRATYEFILHNSSSI